MMVTKSSDSVRDWFMRNLSYEERKKLRKKYGVYNQPPIKLPKPKK